MPQRSFSSFALAMMALPAVLAIALCVASPDRDAAWAIGGVGLPILVFAAKPLRRAEDAISASSEELARERQRVFSGAVVWASLVICLPLAARLAEAARLVDPFIANAMATRWTNVVASGFLIFQGNRLPKILLPLSTCSDPARIQTVRRRTGMAYVLAGVAFAGAWLILPVSLAQPAGLVILALGILAPALVMRKEMLHCLSRRPPDIVGWP